MFTFEDATLERAGLLQFHQSQTVPPFLVVASNDLNQVIPAFLQMLAVKTVKIVRPSDAVYMAEAFVNYLPSSYGSMLGWCQATLMPYVNVAFGQCLS